MTITLSILFLLFTTINQAVASIGDRSRDYQHCVASCAQDQCVNSSFQPSLALRITRWSCTDDCRYTCQQALADMALDQKSQTTLVDLPVGRMVQFHGKWPFKRFLGIQEPFSVLFSFFNLVAHARWANRMWTLLPTELPRFLSTCYKLLPVFGINLWVWSMVFHTRDLAWTERMDYFSAALNVLFYLYLAVMRLGVMYANTTIKMAFTLAMLAVYLAHVSYLTFWTFDYSYNMKFNLSIGLLHNLLWYAWSLSQWIRQPRTRRPTHWWWPVVILTLLTSVTALELLDFQPWMRSIDAHALWHLSTVPIVGWWYHFYWTDAHYLARSFDHSEKLKQ